MNKNLLLIAAIAIAVMYYNKNMMQMMPTQENLAVLKVSPPIPKRDPQTVQVQNVPFPVSKFIPAREFERF